MNRRKFLQVSALAAVTTTTAHHAFAKDDGKVGKMSPADFEKANEKGAAAVAGVKPTDGALSKGDAALLAEVAAGGMMQLEVSKLAMEKATSADVKMLAEAEVKEQTGLGEKLKEIATAKKATLPDAPDEKTQAMLKKLGGMSGAEFDKAYVKESGVKGHQAIDKTMDKVRSKAEDATLKALEAAAHPLVLTHLEVSQAEASGMA